jgi:hypothetical protein
MSEFHNRVGSTANDAASFSLGAGEGRAVTGRPAAA